MMVMIGATSCHSHRSMENLQQRYEQNNALGLSIGRGDNEALYKEAQNWLGVPYRYGGHSKMGADCSGLVMEIYRAVYHIDLQRNSAEIYNKNCKKVDREDLKEGDLVFFGKQGSTVINHVGIYLKNNKFIHASSSKGVVVSDMSERYYVNHFIVAGRVRGR